MRKYTPEERIIAFWSKASITANPDKCWEWQAGHNKGGYGKFGIGGKWKLANRVAWELVNGSIPDSMKVLHECDNPSCINPRHLFLGTDLDNAKDRERKGRGHYKRGENNSCHKLTNEQVLEIRRLYAVGGISYRKLAAMFGICNVTVNDIVRRRIWKHI